MRALKLENISFSEYIVHGKASWVSTKIWKFESCLKFLICCLDSNRRTRRRWWPQDHCIPPICLRLILCDSFNFFKSSRQRSNDSTVYLKNLNAECKPQKPQFPFKSIRLCYKIAKVLEQNSSFLPPSLLKIWRLDSFKLHKFFIFIVVYTNSKVKLRKYKTVMNRFQDCCKA